VILGTELRGVETVLLSLVWVLGEALLRTLILGLSVLVGALRVIDLEGARGATGREGVARRLTLLRLVLTEGELRRTVAVELLDVRLLVCVLLPAWVRDFRAKTALADIPNKTISSRPMTNIRRPFWSFLPNIKDLLSPAIFPAITGYSLNFCSFPPVKGNNLASGNNKFPLRSR